MKTQHVLKAMADLEEFMRNEDWPDEVKIAACRGIAETITAKLGTEAVFYTMKKTLENMLR